MKNQVSYQDRVDRIAAKDPVTVSNMRALFQATSVRYQNAETPADEEKATVISDNVQRWLVNAALRRNRKAQAEAHPKGPLNNAFSLALARTKSARFNGRRA